MTREEQVLVDAEAAEREIDTDTSLTAPKTYPDIGPVPPPRPPDALGGAAFYGPLGALVRTIEPHTEADSVAVLAQSIVYFGNVIGRGPHLLAESRRHYSNLFVCLVGNTAKGRKGSSQAQVERAFRLVDESWLKERVTSGLSSGEGLIWSVRDPIMKLEPVKSKGRVVDYQEVKTDSGVADKRVHFAEEEFSGVLGIMGRQGNSLSPTIRKAWDTGNLNTIVKNNPAKATNAHVSITAHTTRDELLRTLDDTQKGNGFANRIIWFSVKRSKELPFGGTLTDEAVEAAAKPIRLAVESAKSMGEICLDWDPDAAKLWREVYARLSAGRPGLLGAVTSRAEAQVIRLAMIYALADRSKTIGLPHLEAALELWRYAEDSARYVFGDAIGDPLADYILGLLRKAASDGMSRTQIRDALGRNRASTDIGRALAVLQDGAYAHFRAEKTDGRPVERWFFGPGRYAQNDENAKRQTTGATSAGDTAFRSSKAYAPKEVLDPSQAPEVVE